MEDDSKDQPQPPPPTGRRWLRRIAWLLLVMIVVWQLASAAVAFRLTHRKRHVRAETPSADLPIQSLRLQTSDGESLGAWLVRGGSDKPAIVILHGMGGSRGFAVPIMRRLHQDGYTTLAISMRGHGDSSGDRIDFGYSSAKDVVAAVEWLKRDQPDQRIVVCGTSFGSAAAIFAAKELGDRVNGYLLEWPYRDLDTATHNRLSMYLPPVMDNVAYVGLKMWSHVFLPEDPALISPYRAAGDMPASAPVVILTGAHDRYALPAEAESIFERVRSHGTLVRFDHSGHANLFKTDPAKYIEALKRLLAPAPLAPTSQPSPRQS